MPKRRRLLYKEIADGPHDGDTIAIVSMSGTCSCSIFVTVLIPFLDLQETYMYSFVRSRSKNGITLPQSFGNWRT